MYLVEAVGRGIDEIHVAREAVEPMMLLRPGIVPIPWQEPTAPVLQTLRGLRRSGMRERTSPLASGVWHRVGAKAM